MESNEFLLKINITDKGVATYEIKFSDPQLMTEAIYAMFSDKTIDAEDRNAMIGSLLDATIRLIDDLEMKYTVTHLVPLNQILNDKNTDHTLN